MGHPTSLKLALLLFARTVKRFRRLVVLPILRCFQWKKILAVKQSPIGTADNSPPVSTVGRQFSDANKPRQGRKNHLIIAILCRPWRDLLLATRPRVCPPLKRVGYFLSPSGLENSHPTENS